MGSVHAYFSITGVANSTEDDTGISSTQEERKRIDAVIVSMSGEAGNRLQGWLDREKIFDIPDYCLNSHASTGGTNTQIATMRMLEIPVGLDIKVGATFKVALQCGATNKNAYGAYRYTPI